MFEKITEAEINQRSMANVSTTPNRPTAFGESRMDANALKLRFDRLSRYLAGRLNEVFAAINEGTFASAIFIDHDGRRINLETFVKNFLTGDVSDIQIQTFDGIVYLTELGNKVQEIYNGQFTGDLANSIQIIDEVTLSSFYEEFKKLEEQGPGGNGGIKEETDPTVPAWAKQPTKPSYTAEEVGARSFSWMPTYSEVGAEKAGTAASAVSTHNVNTDAHNDIRLLIQGISDRLNAFANSDDESLDQAKEFVAYMQANRGLIEAVTTQKVNYTDIINDLVTNVTNKPLSAAQGVALMALISALQSGKLDATELSNAINVALAQAKASGKFDGDPGKSAYEYAKEGGFKGTESDFAKKIAKEIPSKLSEFENDSEYIKASEAPVQTVNSKTGDVKLNAEDVGARPNTWMPTASDVGARPNTWMPSYSDVNADKAGTAQSLVSGHNTNTDAHNDIRLELKALADRINAVLDSDDTTLDELSEIVTYIKANKALIDSITTSKVNVADIINNLTSNVTNKPLSAAQGVALKALIDALDTDKLDASALTDAINTALAQAKASGEFDGADGEQGQRGTGILNTTTGIAAYTTTTNGVTPAYRISLSTLKTQAKVDEVLIGDAVRYSYYLYPVITLDASYAYLGTRVSIRGATGAAGEAGKSAYQYAQDGGYTGTEAEFISKMAEVFTTETWTFEMEDGSTVTKKVAVVT